MELLIILLKVNSILSLDHNDIWIKTIFYLSNGAIKGYDSYKIWILHCHSVKLKKIMDYYHLGLLSTHLLYISWDDSWTSSTSLDYKMTLKFCKDHISQRLD